MDNLESVKPTLLVIDDVAENLTLMHKLLRDDYKVKGASDGLRGIQIAQSEAPDLILLDVMMPDMDGFSVMNALQQNPNTKDIPIIVVTAKELTPQEKAMLSGHIKALMQKGDFMSDDFLDEITANIR